MQMPATTHSDSPHKALALTCAVGGQGPQRLLQQGTCCHQHWWQFPPTTWCCMQAAAAASRLRPAQGTGSAPTAASWSSRTRASASPAAPPSLSAWMMALVGAAAATVRHQCALRVPAFCKAHCRTSDCAAIQPHVSLPCACLTCLPDTLLKHTGACLQALQNTTLSTQMSAH